MKRVFSRGHSQTLTTFLSTMDSKRRNFPPSFFYDATHKRVFPPRMAIIGICLLFGHVQAATETTSASDATVARHALFQRVSWSEGGQRGDLRAHGVMLTTKNIAGENANYHIWANGTLDAGGNHSKGIQSGAVTMTRNIRTEQVTFHTPGFDLIQSAANQVLAQVPQGARKTGRWQEDIELELPAPGMPKKVRMRLSVQPIKLDNLQQALCIHGAIDRFTASVMKRGGQLEGEMEGQYRCVLVYAPEDHQLYQSGSILAAAHAKGQLRITTTSMAIDAKGQPLHPLLDMNKELGLGESPMVAIKSGALPLAAAQGMKIQQLVSAVSMTAAERATNPGIVTLPGNTLFLDGLAGLVDKSPLESWCTEYGQAHGGEIGKLAGKYMYNVASTGLGEILPATLAFPPLIAPIATAYSIYQIYSSMGELGGAVIAAKVSQSLTPFDWSQPTLAQANKVFPTDTITSGAPNWDGAATGPRPVQIAGTQPSSVPHSMPSGVSTPSVTGPTPGPTMADPGISINKGPALKQLETLAGQNIESVQAPDVGNGVPAESSGPGTTDPMQSSSAQQQAGGGSQTTQSGSSSGGNASTSTGTTPQSGSYSVEGPSVTTDTASLQTPSGSPSSSGFGDRAPQYTDVAQSTPSPSADTINTMFNNAGAVEQGGAGLSVGAPDKAPPPTPQSGATSVAKGAMPKAAGGANPALVAAGIVGGVALVAGGVGLAAAAGGGMGGSYHCSEGSSWCPDIGKCCPTHWISGAGWGAYYIQGRGCYGSAESAARAAIYYGFPYPCVDERKN